jgi:hypothetical protein
VDNHCHAAPMCQRSTPGPQAKGSFPACQQSPSSAPPTESIVETGSFLPRHAGLCVLQWKTTSATLARTHRRPRSTGTEAPLFRAVPSSRLPEILTHFAPECKTARLVLVGTSTRYRLLTPALLRHAHSKAPC